MDGSGNEGDETFFVKRRMRAIRSLLRKNPIVDAASSEGEVLENFFVDLVFSISKAAGEGERDALHSLMRCMSFAAEGYAHDAFSGRMEVSPFGQSDSEGQPVEHGPMVPQWKWPIIVHPPKTGGAFDGSFRQYSALKMFGYTVGKTNGWNVRKRRAFLSDFMESRLPSVVKATFGDEYGEPLSASRLRKIANLIASHATNFYRNDSSKYAVAVAHWEDDLAFLKEKYYDGMGLKFVPWPEPITGD